MRLTVRQLGIVMLLLAILAGWSAGLGLILNVDWFPLFVSLTAAGGISYVFHYRSGSKWMARQLGAKPVDSRALDRVYRRTNLSRKPRLYVTEPMSGANAFTVSYAGEDAIFVTPEIYRASGGLQEPILAHEMAHIQHNDSLIIGFVSVFEQMVSNMSNLWILLLMGGLFGWIILLLFWPFILLVHGLSLITLMVYQPLSATLLRVREFQADRTAAKWTSVDQMKQALKKLEHYNRRWVPDVLRGNQGPLSTHPPLEQRLKRLNAVKKQ